MLNGTPEYCNVLNGLWMPLSAMTVEVFLICSYACTGWIIALEWLRVRFNVTTKKGEVRNQW
jgi:hypothetical protein